MKLKISSWFTLLEFTRKKDCLSWVRPSGMTAYLGAKGPVEIPWSISLPASGTSHKNVKYSQSPNVVGPHPLQVKEGAAAEECQYPLSAHVEAWETLTKPIRSHRRATRVVRCAPAVIPAMAASAGLCCVSCWGSQDTKCDINYWPWVNSFCEGVFLMHLLHLACAAISLAPIKKKKVLEMQRGHERGSAVNEYLGMETVSKSIAQWPMRLWNTMRCFLWLRSQGVS